MTVRAAIVGLGRWGQRLVTSIEGSDRIRIVAGVARGVERAQDFAAAKGFPLGNDYASILADPSIDAVVLATPHSLHAEQVVAAAAAGKQIFCEKPFTLDSASAARAIAAAQAAGVVLAVGFNRRFLPSIRDLVRRAKAGELGTLLHIDANFSANAVGFYKEGSWRLDQTEVPCGGLTGFGVHMIDAMIELLGPVRSVFALSTGRVMSDIDDTTAVLLQFESGASASLATLFATPMHWRFHAFGSAAHAELRGPARLALTRLGDAPPKEIEYAPLDTERAELEAFADAIEGRAPFAVSLDDAFHGVAVFEAIVKSAKRGQVVSLG
jgi:predicted dehydrogenase